MSIFVMFATFGKKLLYKHFLTAFIKVFCKAYHILKLLSRAYKLQKKTLF